jgi:hypothetical protein
MSQKFATKWQASKVMGGFPQADLFRGQAQSERSRHTVRRVFQQERKVTKRRFSQGKELKKIQEGYWVFIL